MTVQTFKELQDKVLRQLDEAGDTDTTLALVKDGLNYANRQRVASERWKFLLWDTPETISVIASQRLYSLHPEFFRTFYFRLRSTGDFLSEVDEGSLIESGADWNNDVDIPSGFVLWSRTEVATQPSSASVLAVASTSGADNGARSVIIRGNTASGVTTETIACGSNGSVSFTKILKVTKKGSWVGTMTITANGGAVAVLTLFPAEAGRSYQQFELLALPPSTDTIEYRFYRASNTMAEDEDRPDIPSPFEDLLVYDTLLDFAAYNHYDGGVVQTWQRKRDTILTGLQQAYSDDRTLESATDYTSYVPR